MKTQKRQCKCLHCKKHFLPDYRHRERQRFCFKADCRKARKRAIQKAWLEKPGNEKYFRDEENAKRVREWQKGHPGYWKNTTRWRKRTLQDDIATTTRQLVAKGYDILGMVPGMNFERFHEKTCPQSATTPQSSSPIQLDRSPVGAGKLFHPV